MPIFDSLFFASLMSWGMMLIVIVAALWAMYELFMKFSLIGSFSDYSYRQKARSEAK
jgi:hypothetical protein